MNDTVLPNSVQQKHIVIFDLLMKQRLEKLQLRKLLIYMIDTVDSELLFYLAEQFGLLGFNGWKLADTDKKKRALIKQSIELHRYKGTIWSIKEAVKSVGYPDVEIVEHVGHWAKFTVRLHAGNNAVNASQINDVVEMIKTYKNVRSHLVGVEFVIEYKEGVILSDESFEAPAGLYADTLFTGGDFLYDGTYQYNGNRNYSNDNDLLELTIT